MSQELADPAPTCDHDPWEGWDDDCAANHVGDLAGAIRAEVVMLWSDLTIAQRHAIDGNWSVQCDNLVGRIVTLSRLVGACPWGHVDVATLLSGLYGRVHDEHGIEYPPVDWPRVEAVAARYKRGTDER